MSQRSISHWLRDKRSHHRAKAKRRQIKRRLRGIETLERRALLAAGLHVTIPDDIVDAFDNETSLREAVLLANDPTAGTAGDGDADNDGDANDTITFDSSLDGTPIVLSISGRNEDSSVTGDLDITASTTIVGNGLSNTIIDAGGVGGLDDRVFHAIGSYSGGNQITIRGVTITGGNPGSGFTAVGGGVSVTDDARVTIEDSAITGNTAWLGGGLHNVSTTSLQVRGSIVSGNSADAGGGIATSGSFAVNDSTISDNTSVERGGGMAVFGPSTVNNSTISGNSSAIGGGITIHSSLTVNNSTISANTASDQAGGIHIRGTTTLRNNIVAGNSSATGAELSQPFLQTFASSNNLFGHSGLTQAQAFHGIAPGTNDIDATSDGGASATHIPTLLGGILAPLADNGGPTQTHALVAGSPAIDAGDNSLIPLGVTSDQRGAPFARAVNTVDIGAFETQTLSLVVDTATDESDGDFTVGDLSLREAITIANSNPGADTITFASGPSEAFENGGTIRLTQGEIEITDQLTIDGSDSPLVLITGDANGDDTTDSVGITDLSQTAASELDDNSRIFNATSSNAPITIDSLTLTGGRANSSGGAVNGRSAVTVTNSTISGNSSNGYGGGMFVSGSATVTASTISGNSGRFGGGMYVSGNATVTASTISGNSGLTGGGMYVHGVSATVTTSTISGNSSIGYGGGMYASGARVTASTITGNSSGNSGGGMFVSYGGATVTNSIVSGNSASFGGNEIAASSTVNADANNLFGHGGLTTAEALFGFTPGTSDINATSDGSNTPLTSILDTTLADNGGPTLTHALIAGSPAIDAGNNSLIPVGVTSDQRGAPFARAVNTVDIGAFETHSLRVDNAVDENDGDHSAGDLSLREAVLLANARPGADTITFDSSLNGVSILISNQTFVAEDDAGLIGDFDIYDDVMIVGNGADNTVIDARISSLVDRVFDVHENVIAEFTGLTLTGINSGGTRGGGILVRSSADVTVNDSSIRGIAAFGGGGIAVDPGGNLLLSNSTISNNRSNVRQGGGLTIGGTATVRNSTISGNEGSFGGGGISVSGELTLENSTVTGNVSSFGDGGGLAVFGTATLKNSIVSGNSAFDSFVAPDIQEIFSDGGTVNVDGNNLLGDSRNDNSLAFSGFTPGASDITATSDGTDPTALSGILDPLADNGGPTRTHALVPGSPAINAGDNTLVPAGTNFDQRGSGFDRIKGSTIDIGAFERQINITAAPEFLVNDSTSGFQVTYAETRSVAANAAGDMVVTYAGSGPGDTQGIFARRFDQTSTPLGPAYLVNVTTSGNQRYPSVAIGDAGESVVVWSGKGAGDNDGGVYARLYDISGSSVSGEIKVSETTPSSQHKPLVAKASDGSFIISWSGKGAGDFDSGVFARRYTAGGVPLSGEFLVNTTTTGNQQEPDIAIAGDGSFAISWSGTGPGDVSGVFFQRYDSAGTPVAAETRVNTTVSGQQRLPSVGIDSANNVTVVWSGRGNGDSSGVFLQRFDAGGNPVGGEELVNSTTLYDQNDASISVTPNGAAVISWTSLYQEGVGGGGRGVYVQEYDASGGKTGGETLVNGTTFLDQQFSSVAVRGEEAYSVVWSGRGIGDTAGVFAATILRTPAPLMAGAGENTSSSASALTTGDLDTIVTAAIDRFAQAGATAAQLALLESVDVQIVDLGSSLLGTAADGTIQIDVDAAGWGWFIDQTPEDDSEFDGSSSESPAYGQIDLLSVVLHEMAHVLGHDHEDDGFLAKTLETGVRETAIDQLFADNLF